MPHEFLKYALACARRGWLVHPLRPRGKEALLKGWQRRASRDPYELRAFWFDHPNANIGLRVGRASGFFALDVDGAIGKSSLATLEATHGSLPETFEVRSGRPGGDSCHKYFQYPALERGQCIKNSESKIGDDLDVRSDGGNLVGPGSIHPLGGAYEVICAAELAPAPAWLLALLIADASTAAPVSPPAPARSHDDLSAYQRSALTRAIERMRNARAWTPDRPGTRNPTLNKEAYGLARARVPREIAEPALKNAALDSGLEPKIITKTFESGWRAGSDASPSGPTYARGRRT